MVPVGDKEDTVYLKIEFKNNFLGGSEGWTPAQKWQSQVWFLNWSEVLNSKKCVLWDPSLTPP